MGTDSTNTAFFFSRSEQRAPGGGLDKIHQFPRGPQKKSWLPSPPTTVNRKTGTLQQEEAFHCVSRGRDIPTSELRTNTAPPLPSKDSCL